MILDGIVFSRVVFEEKYENLQNCFLFLCELGLKPHMHLEPSCCKKRQKSPNQETGLENRGRLKVLNDTKLIQSLMIKEVSHATSDVP